MDMSFFSAEYSGDTVTIGGKAFPVGHFAVELLNRASLLHFDDAPDSLGMYEMLSELNAGKLNDASFARAHREMLATYYEVKRLPPFDVIDTDSREAKAIEYLFSPENALILRAIASTADYEGTPCDDNGNLLTEIETCDEIYDATKRRLRFYSYIAEDCIRAIGVIRDIHAKATTADKWNEAVWMRALQQLNEEYDDVDVWGCGSYGEGFVSARTSVEYYPHQTEEDGYCMARRRYFARYIDFVATDFFEGLQHHHFPQRCGICGRWFLMENGHIRKYCDGTDPNDPRRRPCRKVAADRQHRDRENPDAHPIRALCAARLNTLRKQKLRGVITAEFAEAAKRYAQDCRDRAVADHTYAQTQYRQDMMPTAIRAAAEKALK